MLILFSLGKNSRKSKKDILIYYTYYNYSHTQKYTFIYDDFYSNIFIKIA